MLMWNVYRSLKVGVVGRHPEVGSVWSIT